MFAMELGKTLTYNSKNSALRSPMYFMALYGGWRLGFPKKSRTWIKWYNLYALLYQGYYVVGAIREVYALPSLWEQDVNAGIGSLSKLIFSIVVLMKMFVSQTKRFKNLLIEAQIQEDYIYFHESESYQNIYKGYVRYINLLAKIVAFELFLNVFYLIESGLESNREFNEIFKTGVRPPPDKPFFGIHMWYPFDRAYHQVFVLIDSSIKITVTGCSNLGVILISNGLMIILKAHLDILHQRFLRCCSREHADDEGSIKKHFSELAGKHQKLIEFMLMFNESIKYIVLCEYLASSLVIGFTVLQFLAGRDVEFNCGFFVTNFGQLLLLAWNANEISVKSVDLAQALYESEWYNQGTPTRTTIQIMILRCQKPLVLTNGPFGPMTLVDAMSRLKLAYSYVTFMKANV